MCCSFRKLVSVNTWLIYLLNYSVCFHAGNIALLDWIAVAGTGLHHGGQEHFLCSVRLHWTLWCFGMFWLKVCTGCKYLPNKPWHSARTTQCHRFISKWCWKDCAERTVLKYRAKTLKTVLLSSFSQTAFYTIFFFSPLSFLLLIMLMVEGMCFYADQL